MTLTSGTMWRSLNCWIETDAWFQVVALVPFLLTPISWPLKEGAGLLGMYGAIEMQTQIPPHSDSCFENMRVLLDPQVALHNQLQSLSLMKGVIWVDPSLNRDLPSWVASCRTYASYSPAQELTHLNVCPAELFKLMCVRGLCSKLTSLRIEFSMASWAEQLRMSEGRTPLAALRHAPALQLCCMDNVLFMRTPYAEPQPQWTFTQQRLSMGGLDSAMLCLLVFCPFHTAEAICGWTGLSNAVPSCVLPLRILQTKARLGRP
eukprot:510761-Pelagomonas_calceolata.AAC.5